MADIYTREKRSQIMSNISSTATRPENRLCDLIMEMPYDIEVRRNVRELPGQPDVVIDRLRVAIFMDGCFYHSCPRHGHLPKSNVEYWVPKLHRTVQRDARTRQQLRRRGWSVWRVWEHDLRNSAERATANRLRKLLERRNLQCQEAP